MEIIRLLDYIDFCFYYSEYFSLLSNFILLYNTIYKGLIRFERFFLIFLSEYRFFPMIYGGKTLFSFVFQHSIVSQFISNTDKAKQPLYSVRSPYPYAAITVCQMGLAPYLTGTSHPTYRFLFSA